MQVFDTVFKYLMQRTLQIFINDLFYKEIKVDTDADGDYAIGPIFSMINKEKDQGRLTEYIPPSGQLAIRVKYHL
jgi:hypothetical protein